MDRILALAAGACLVASLSCLRPGPRNYRLLPADPDYLVEAPDSTQTSFADVLYQHTAHGAGWVDLQTGMALRIENACFRDGSTQRGLADFVGTEIARYQAKAAGLTEVGAVRLLPQRPAGVKRVDQLIPEAQRRLSRHRFLYQILINPTDTERVAILLSSDSAEDLDVRTERLLTNSALICGGDSEDCTVFPETSSVALEMEIFVNGSSTFVLWGSRLSSVAPAGSRPRLFRLYQGRSRKVEFDSADPRTLATPLLPGDQIEL